MTSRPSDFVRATPGTPEREPIAIVGIGCRFPGASTPSALWHLLAGGRDAIREVPPGRFDIESLYDAVPATPGKVMTRRGGFVERLEEFDAEFFGVSPREAERLDPQQRLLLETAWEAIEDAGIVPARLVGSPAGVFVGLWTNEYESRLFSDRSAIDFYMTIGSGRYAASGRLSYFLGLQGPSLTLDTGCSSSLVAVHLACQSLWSGETELALAGGANAIVEPFVTIAYSQSQMMAPDGRCKFGDARADGYVRSDGAAVIILKPLSTALADGDPIYATIAGSAVTNDGRSSGFLTTPAVEGQEEVLRRAYRDAGISPGRVHYVEAHGTGTRAGDPVELQALGSVLKAGRPADRPCRVGSVKTNIGHTEGAAGIAGLIKAALCLKHRAVPQSLHFETPNPAIPWHELPVVVPRMLEDWPADDPEGVAGVSSFGISGTNAHVVLREAPRTVNTAAAESARPLLLPVSAHTPEALTAMTSAYGALVATVDDNVLVRTCFAAGARRGHHAHRVALAAADRATLLDQIDAFLAGEEREGVSAGRQLADPKVVFVFPGQGSQWLGMGCGLYAGEPAFRSAMDECDGAIRELTGWSVVEELMAGAEGSRLTQIDVIQPALFAMEVALAALWRSWGVEPAAVVGHSMGEVAAACVAGALTIRDAAMVICRRSQLLERVSGKGAMAVVELTREEAEKALRGREHLLSVAVSNSVRSTVISGDREAINDLIEELEDRNVFCRPVKVDVASHSPQMDPLRDELREVLAGLQPQAAGVPIYSTVMGTTTDGAGFNPGYWVDNLRKPVLFGDAVQRLLSDGHTIFIEMSPHPILTTAVREGLKQAASGGIAIGSTRRDEDERLSMLGSLGAVYAAGHDVEWGAIYPGRHGMTPLPTYAFQRERYWIEASDSKAPSERPPIVTKAASVEALSGALFEPCWEPQSLPDSAKEAAIRPGRYVIIGDPAGLAGALGGALQTSGAASAFIEWRDRRASAEGGGHVVDAGSAEDSTRAPGLFTVRSDGAYVITGGLGDHGLQVARWLSDAGARRLILVSRTPLPERRTWARLDPNHPSFAKVSAIRALEARGVSVHIATIDIADEAGFQSWVTRYREEGWPSIRGAVHTAGILAPRLLHDMTYEDLQRVVRPKVAGALTLDRVLSDDPLDFLVFSSVASILPTPGQMNYAADMESAPALQPDALLRVIESDEDRAAYLEAWVRGEVGRVLKRPADRIDVLKPLRSLGVDSLMGLELRNRLERAIGSKLPATIVWNYPTVAALAAHLGERLPLLAKAAQPSLASQPCVIADIPQGDDELDRLLEELGGLSHLESRRLLADEA